MKKYPYVFLAMLVLLLPACYMPLASQSIQAEITSTPASQTGGQDPSIVFTAAAQTIEAELTRLAPSPLSATPIIPPTLISIPTKTIVPSATTVPLPCNRVSYNAATIDVTIPDWQVMPPGQVFTKTWRLTNAGTCTWTPAYRLAFYQGDTMGVPTGYAQSLTSGNIPPGGTVDVSVNLTAPVTPGTYKGYWHMQEPGGQYFGIGVTNGGFYVAITVGGDTVLTVNPISGESGSVSGSGSVTPNIYNVGDTIMDDGKQIFLSFDISSIPAGSTIKNVKFDETVGYTVTGAPFTSLGCLYFYGHNYGALDAGDFVLVPPPGGLNKLCAAISLDGIISGDDDWTNAVQARVGTTRFQMRMQFADNVTDFNATEDLVRLGTVTLTITYEKP